MSNDSETSKLIADIERLSDEFNDLIQTRHNTGATEYGELAFLKNDMVGFLLEELADANNYLRYLYIKFRLLQEMFHERGIDLSASLSEEVGTEDTVPSDPPPFVPSKEISGFLSRTQQGI